MGLVVIVMRFHLRWFACAGRKLHSQCLCKCVSCRYISLHFTCSKFHAILKSSVCVCLSVFALTNSNSCLRICICICISAYLSDAERAHFSHFHARPHMCCTHADDRFESDPFAGPATGYVPTALHSALSDRPKEKKSTKFHRVREILKRFVRQFLSSINFYLRYNKFGKI